MKDLIKNSTFKVILFGTIIAVILIFITFNYLIEFSSFSVGIAKGILGVTLVWMFDEYGMKGINTIEELKKGNVAYALFLLGLFIVIAAAIINS